ncbi:metal ABC transporter ATP-binding protein [Corynebacterium sp. L4756]|uniref:metal ABC transporter ATP-binding protein n=1 Tax=unclassified Corynebacterium TaxID=2624378 RepID=UPI00374CFCCC
MIDIENLSVSYDANKVLDSISAHVERGRITGLVGANGAGKSTLVKAAVGLVRAEPGARITFAAKSLEHFRDRLGYMPQQAALDWSFPAVVEDIAIMGLSARLPWYRWPGKEEKAAAHRALERTGAADLAKRPISALSGGQRQRVLLARTLAAEPEVLILDEPFAGVDAASQDAIVTVLQRLRDNGVTVLLVHHNLAEVAEYCDDVILLGAHGIISSGPTAETLTDGAITQLFTLPR